MTKKEKKALGITLVILSNKNSVCQLATWVKEHALYLAQEWNYNKKALDKVLETYLPMASFYIEELENNKDNLEEFRLFSALTVVKMELHCK